MRLKQVRLAGFKSFVDVTKVDFPSALTAIVGPNGCGKSNIIDAVRWVLGEASAKNLRGQSMTDVIFNGASGRSAANRAMVELIFDNREHKLGGAYSAYTDIALRRELLSDGSNHYYLNGQRCRKRDISDIFLGTGLGPRSYAIIEQGMISRLIESKPAELRVLIEEAAGVSKYKERRRETQLRIEHTQTNMQRLFDIETGLSQLTDTLKVQAESALSFRKLRQQQRELKQLEYYQSRNQAVAQSQHNDQQITKLQSEIHQLEQALTLKENQRQIVSLDLEREYDNQQKKQQQQQKLEAQQHQLQQSIAMSKQAQLQKSERMQSLRVEINKTEQQLQQQTEQQTQLLRVQEQHTETLEQQGKTLESIQGEYSQAQQQLAKDQAAFDASNWLVQQQQSQHLSAQKELSLAQKSLSSLQQQLMTVQGVELAQLQQSKAIQIAKKQQLDACELLLETAKTATEKLERQVEIESLSLDGIQATIQKLEMSKHEQQLALNILNQQLEDCDSQLSEQSLGRLVTVNAPWAMAFEQVHSRWMKVPVVSALPSDIMSAVFTNPKQVQSGERHRDLALLSNLASQCQPRNLALFAENILLCTSLQQAWDLRSHLQQHESLITSEGYWIGQNWQLMDLPVKRLNWSGLQQDIETQTKTLAVAKMHVSEMLTSQLQQQQHCAQIQQQLNEAKEQFVTHQNNKHVAELEAQQAKSKLESLSAQDHAAQAQRQVIQQQLSEQRQQCQDLQLVLEQIASEQAKGQAVEQLQTQCESARQNVISLEKQLTNAKKAQEDCLGNLHQQQIKSAALSAQIEQRQSFLAEQHKSLSNLEHAKVETQDDLSQLRLNKLEHELAQIAEQLNLSLEQRRDRLTLIDQMQHGVKTQQKSIEKQRKLMHALELKQESVKTRLEALDQQYQKNPELASLEVPSRERLLEQHDFEHEFEDIQQKIERLGPVNLAAELELKDKQAELEAMIEQRRDLDLSLEQLAAAIALIDKQSSQQFNQTFDQINQHIAVLFPQVFGGGKAYLQRCPIAGDSDENEQGLRIMAQPPGKKNSSIMSLSGGEKALTALALVFAIFELNPAPFCMLDEVDAPLDDVNVGRFANMVEQMSQRVQFVMITHNKQSMEKSSQLLGVTMHEAGVSRVVSVDVEQALTWLE
ncbi:chromosome segregation protein SMC [Alginatibacterium sediminis]|nr:chromosome segregation protein SMC [Alginatibacterium sediminis]